MYQTNCRMCGGDRLVKWLDLGHQPHSDQFHQSRSVVEKTYPLEVALCQTCGLNQLTYVVPAEELYLHDYLYESSITATADRHWTEFASTVAMNVGLKPGARVMDIGSNDGTLLTKFQALGHLVLGVDPTPEATRKAIARGVPTLQKFFNHETARAIEDGPIDLIVGTNVFAHVHNLHDFMLGVQHLIGQDGVFVFESPYMADFLAGVEYDTVYHQHVSYLSLRPVIEFLYQFDMEVFHVERRPLHGGSFRVYIANKGRRTVSSCVADLASRESWGLEQLVEFTRQVDHTRNDLIAALVTLKQQGYRIAAVSAPAKGNTLLNYTGAGKYLDFITDKSQLKQGRFTPGSFLEVFPDEELLSKRAPEYVLVLAWNFYQEVVQNVLKTGYAGRFMRPLPKFYCGEG